MFYVTFGILRKDYQDITLGWLIVGASVARLAPVALIGCISLLIIMERDNVFGNEWKNKIIKAINWLFCRWPLGLFLLGFVIYNISFPGRIGRRGFLGCRAHVYFGNFPGQSERPYDWPVSIQCNLRNFSGFHIQLFIERDWK